jgi:hypothetical protein
LTLYRRLLAVRRARLALSAGDFALLDGEGDVLRCCIQASMIIGVTPTLCAPNQRLVEPFVPTPAANAATVLLREASAAAK